jgi:hypothetical protein
MEPPATAPQIGRRRSPATTPKSGTPPGRFLGAGISDLDARESVEPGTEVTE